jgi:hypothetical protein
MVLEENAQFHSLNKFIVAFLNENKNSHEMKNLQTPELFDKLIENWKIKSNKFKSLVRKNEDKNIKPPRPKNKYILFCDTERQKVKQEYPEKNIREITCELGRRWKKFQDFPDPKIDEELTKAFLKDQERYHTTKKVKETVDNSKNKFRSEYIFFCEQERKKEAKTADAKKLTMKELGFRWSNMKNDNEVYEKFSSIFEAKKKQYEQSLTT